MQARLASILLMALYSPLALSAPPRDLDNAPRRGESIYALEGVSDLPDAPEVVAVSHGLVWLELASGASALSATKVDRGVYLTRAGYSNVKAGWDSMQSRIATLQREAEALRQRLATRPESVPVPTLEPLPLGNLPPVQPLDVPVPSSTPADCPEVSESSGLGWRGALVVFGIGVLAGGFVVYKATR